MPNNTVWISEADDHEQGSFCDRGSGHIYENGNVTDAIEAETNAIERGDEVIFVDAPIGGGDYEIEPGQRFNIYMSEDDSQGVTTPSIYSPGR